jgi:Ca2+-binding RTX toxin-like protein
MPNPKGTVDKDTLVGVAPQYQADYSDAAPGLVAVVGGPRYGFSNMGWASGDIFQGISGFVGSKHNDLLIGDEGKNRLDGGDGDDTLIGGAGGDVFNGGIGRDTVSFEFAAGPVVMSLAYVVDEVGEADGDTYGSEEIVIGSAFGDFLGGREPKTNDTKDKEGDNLIEGRGGSDTLAGYGGADTLDGGEGVDFATYQNANQYEATGLIISLANPTINTGDAKGDIFTGVEGLIGTKKADQLYGDSGNNILDGYDGEDFFAGGAGDDLYKVNSAGDVVSEAANEGTDLVETEVSYALGPNTENLTAVPGKGNLTLTGNGLANVITGNEGNNVIVGGGGADVLQGGAGTDTYYVTGPGATIVDSGVTDIVYTNSVFALVGTAQVGKIIATGPKATIKGGARVDNITGTNGNDVLYGYGGNDTINGLKGNDKIYGGTGKDTLFGGKGKDSFYFDAKPAKNNVDTVKDWSSKDDALYLSRKFFKGGLTKGKLDAEKFSLGQAFEADDRIIYNQSSGTLSYDVDGAGGKGAVTIAKLGAGKALFAHDIIVY